MDVKRQVAYKVKLSDLRKGKYVKEEGWTPNYILTRGLKVSRINVIGVVISKENDMLSIDDGSSPITLRNFEKSDMFSPFEIGDIVVVIGRPREFNDDKYIVPEIVKKLNNPKWAEVRKNELEEMFKDAPEEIEKKEEVIDEEVKDPYTDIFNIIESLDSGEGAQVDEVILRSKLENCETIIENLIGAGDVFEIKPGRLKVLK